MMAVGLVASTELFAAEFSLLEFLTFFQSIAANGSYCPIVAAIVQLSAAGVSGHR